MTRKPLIGITTYHREGVERPRFFLPTAYVDAIRVSGGVPALLPPGEAEIDELLERVDGLVFGGGGDIHPERHGGTHHAASYFIDHERDEFELKLVARALERGTPTLAICRGLQVVNVALGGTLHVHLPDLGVAETFHRTTQELHAFHDVRLEPGSRLAQVFSEVEFSVASWHHQGVARLGDGVKATGWASDGTVEALEVAGAPHLMAVQWHPELEIEDGSLQRRLFAAFVELADCSS